MDALLSSKAEQLAGDIASQVKTVEDLNELLRSMMKSALERMLDTEMDVHLDRKILPDELAESPPEKSVSGSAPSPAGGKKRSTNRRNGRSRKTVRSDLGELTIATPRDRNGTFDPQLIGK